MVAARLICDPRCVVYGRPVSGCRLRWRIRGITTGVAINRSIYVCRTVARVVRGAVDIRRARAIRIGLARCSV